VHAEDKDKAAEADVEKGAVEEDVATEADSEKNEKVAPEGDLMLKDEKGEVDDVTVRPTTSSTESKTAMTE
jgi:hypothetical protein